MSNVFYSSHKASRTRMAVLVTAIALAHLALAEPALADAGDRDLDVNEMNLAPNLLAPKPANAPSDRQAKTVRGMTAMTGHAKATRQDRRY